MVQTTVRGAVAEALEDLSKIDFDKFSHRLLDYPEIRRRAVEGKSFLQITELLVSTFPGARALKVTLEILRLINCNEVAEKLDSKTEAFQDNGDPTFRKNSDGDLDLDPSQEAPNYAPDNRSLTAALSLGNVNLSMCTIQFGKYKGQTFKWLLENDVNYTAYLVANHQVERQHSTCQSQLMANKDSLTQYAMAYPEVLKVVRFQLSYLEAKERSCQSGKEGMALVGFGRHRSLTLQDLYNSKNTDIISYVNYLWGMKSTCEPGSRMEDAIRYIFQRDQEEAVRNTQTERETGPQHWTPVHQQIKVGFENAKKK
uniref:Pyrin domain-containing protein n=1 Tax=Anabas testudineus TaxID=64144 RepID=A0AAQ6IDE0_ANATE